MPASRGKRKKIRLRPAVILILIVAVLFAGILLFFRYGSSTEGGGFPIPVSGLSVQQMDLLGGNVAVSEDAVFRLYNASGSERYRVELDYSSPVFVTDQSRVLLYERGGTRAKICDRSGEVCSKELQGSILTGGFGGGKAALATLTDNTTSKLAVYDANLIHEIFVWQTSSYIARVAVSPNGRYVAAAVMDNEGGDRYTEVSVFDTKSSDTLFTNRYTGETILNLSFSGNSDILVVTDQSVSGISGRNKLAFRTVFGYGTLKGISCSAGRTALILTKISDGKDYLCVYDTRGALHLERQIDSGARSLSFSKSQVSILYGDKVVQYSASDAAKEPVRLDTQSDSIRIVSSGSTVYVLTSEEIQRF